MTKKNESILLGAHMPISGGFYKAIEKGDSIGCTAIQFFTKSNRQWRAKKITKEDVEKFKTAWKNSGVKEVVAHASYLINLASPNKETQKKSVEALAIELERCELLGIPYLVLHPGASLDSTEETAIKTVAQNLDKALELAPGKTKILLETMAGQGSNLGYKFEQLAEIRKLSKNKTRIEYCLDTCHILAAGYDIRNSKSYAEVIKAFDKTLGLKNLKAIHLNDSKCDLGSRKDRHEHIGKGKVGLKGFDLIMNDKRLKDIPKILETPKGDGLEEDIMNLKALRKLVK